MGSFVMERAPALDAGETCFPQGTEMGRGSKISFRLLSFCPVTICLDFVGSQVCELCPSQSTAMWQKHLLKPSSNCAFLWLCEISVTWLCWSLWACYSPILGAEQLSVPQNSALQSPDTSSLANETLFSPHLRNLELALNLVWIWKKSNKRLARNKGIEAGCRIGRTTKLCSLPGLVLLPCLKGIASIVVFT